MASVRKRTRAPDPMAKPHGDVPAMPGLHRDPDDGLGVYITAPSALQKFMSNCYVSIIFTVGILALLALFLLVGEQAPEKRSAKQGDASSITGTVRP